MLAAVDSERPGLKEVSHGKCKPRLAARLLAAAVEAFFSACELTLLRSRGVQEILSPPGLRWVQGYGLWLAQLAEGEGEAS